MVSKPKLHSFFIFLPLLYFFPYQQPREGQRYPLSPPFFMLPLLGRQWYPYWAVVATLLGLLILPFRAASAIIVTLFKATTIRPYFLGLMASSRSAESSALLASTACGRDGGHSSKATTFYGLQPIIKGKQTFLPYTYCGKTTHAFKKVLGVW